MTVTSNIHVGLPAWASQTYVTGNRVATGGNAYQCVGPGLSTAAPTGQFGTINNGGVATWRWLSAIDFTTVQAWVNSWPATLVDNMLGLLWNDGPITTTVGTSYMSASGHTMGAFTATLTCAPGESFRDSLRDNDYPLVFDPTKGVSFVLPNGVGNINYLNITDVNVIVDGLQFQDPFSTSNCSIWGTNPGATGSILRNCILDGYGQSSGAAIVQPSDAFTMANCLVIDRQAGGVQALGGPAVLIAPTGAAAFAIANSLVVGVNSPTQVGVLSSSTSVSSIIRNSACFGFSGNNSFGSTGGTVTADHCVVDSASFTGSGITDGGSNVFGALITNQFPLGSAGADPFSAAFSADFGSGGTAIVDYRPIAATTNFLNAGTTDTTDVPAGTDIRGVSRPQSTNWDVGPWELVTAGPLPGPLVGRQVELSDQNHRLSFSRAGVVGISTQLPAVTRYIVTRQQQPDHPLPVVLAGVRTVVTVPAAKPTIFNRQEAPRDSVPASFLWGPSRFPNVATLGQVQRIPGRPQEQPSHPLPLMQQRIFGQNVAPPPLIGAVFVRQEVAQQIPPTLASGVIQASTSVRPPITDTAIVRQQQPDVLQPVLLAGVQGPNVRSPVSDRVTVVQQQPDYPMPTVRSGPPGATVKPPSPNILVRQALPDQPPPLLLAGVPPANPPPSGPTIGGTMAIGRQEQPGHPPPSTSPGIQGPSVRVPVLDSIMVRQQPVDTLQPVILPGPFGQLIVPPPSSRVLTVQELPAQPPPLLRFGPQGPNVRPPAADSIVVRQQQPDHPPSLLGPSLPGAAVLLKVTDSVVGRQQQPDHPFSLLLAGRQGPNVLVKVTDSIVVRQQQPDHPLSSLLPGLPGRNVALIQSGVLIGRQQQPEQPGTVFAAGVQTSTFLPSTPRVLFVRQEQPGHPLSSVRAGVYTNRKHVHGRTVALFSR